MTWFIGQSLLVIAASFLLGLAVGWLLFGRRSAGPAAETASSAAEIAAPDTASANTASASTAAPESAVPDAAIEPEVIETTAAAEAAVPAEASAADPAADVAAEAPAVAVDTAEPAKPQPVPAQAAAPAAEAVAEVAAPAEPAVPERKAAPARKTRAKKAVAGDDLKRIEGIGPKMSAALNAAGISTYGQLAAADEKALRDAIEAAGLRFAPSIVTWAQQAQLLADGDEAAFEDLTRRLVAGRDTGRV